jgi:SAM-dependent methyltransferase
VSDSFEFPGEYYEIIRRDFRNLEAETKFFTSFLPASGRVLDLGCGTGTNLRELSSLGHECVGVDQSRAFIDYAKNQAEDIEYSLSRASEYTTNSRFDLIYSVFVTLNYLRRDELPVLLAKVKEWLSPEGHFVVDIGHMLNFVDGYQPYIIAHHRHDGILMTRFIRHLVNAHEANWRHEETIIVRERDGRVLMYDNFFDQMALTGPELRGMLQAAGFRVAEEFGSFRKDPPSPKGKGHLIFVATHADV